MRHTRYRLIEYRAGDAQWLDDVIRRSLTGTHQFPNGGTVTATEIDRHQITISLEDALRDARDTDGSWPAQASQIKRTTDHGEQ